MLGFTIPLLVGLGVQCLLGALLLGPPALSQPAVALSRLSYRKEGTIVTYTIASMLALLLLNPLYDGYRLMTATADDEKTSRDLAEHEYSTLLSAVLLLTNLFGLFVVRRLGLVVANCERMALSEKALLRQVQGLQQEYSRVMDTGAAPAKGAAAKEGAGQAEQGDELEGLREEKAALVERLAAAEKAQRSAEANLSALKTQTRGLEHEYDRLLAEHEALQKKLQRAGLEAPADTGAFSKKEA